MDYDNYNHIGDRLWYSSNRLAMIAIMGLWNILIADELATLPSNQIYSIKKAK